MTEPYDEQKDKSSKKIDKDDHTYYEKMKILVNLLVQHKSTTRAESFILFCCYYSQLLSGFFSTNLKLLNTNYTSDKYLNYIYQILRVKELFYDNYLATQITLLVNVVILLLFIIFFAYVVKTTSEKSFYTFRESLINMIFKVFYFIYFNAILDLALSMICFESKNSNFLNQDCTLKNNVLAVIASILVLILCISIEFYISIFYNDSLFLKSSFFSRVSCNYEIYMTMNSIVFSIILSQIITVGVITFLIYNILVSILLLKFYYETYPYIDNTTNGLIGLFHMLYAYSSIIFLALYIINLQDLHDIGFFYLSGIILFCLLFYVIKISFEEHIIVKTQFNKIHNKYHLIFYLKSILEIAQNIDNSTQDRALLIGIIELHKTECPLLECLAKENRKIYHPLQNEWSKRTTHEINDKVFLANFLLMIVNYYISQTFYSPDILMNISHYYLEKIGNFCRAMVYYRKVSEMKLNFEEEVSFTRLKFLINQALVKKLKPAQEGCSQLETLNTLLYFEYEDLCHKLSEEIKQDILLNMDFWKTFKENLESTIILDYNKVFSLSNYYT